MNKLVGGFKNSSKVLFFYKNRVETDYIGNIVNNKLKIYDGNKFKEGVIEEYTERVNCYKLRLFNKLLLKYVETTIYSNNIGLDVLHKDNIINPSKYVPINLLDDKYIIKDRYEYIVVSVVRLYKKDYIYYNINNNSKIYCDGLQFIVNNNLYNEFKMEALINNKKNIITKI